MLVSSFQVRILIACGKEIVSFIGLKGIFSSFISKPCSEVIHPYEFEHSYVCVGGVMCGNVFLIEIHRHKYVN